VRSCAQRRGKGPDRRTEGDKKRLASNAGGKKNCGLARGWENGWRSGVLTPEGKERKGKKSPLSRRGNKKEPSLVAKKMP